jgi:hypothetical protein
MCPAGCGSAAGFSRTNRDDTVSARPSFKSLLKTCGLTVRNLQSGWTGGIGVLETIVVLLILLWALGMLSSYTLGGVLHLLLVVALVVVVIRVLQGRRVV